MASESELCVDRLLALNGKIDGLCEQLESDSTSGLIEESRNLLSETQMYVDNNRYLIPPYILKKISDSLRRLETHTKRPDKSKLAFKFNSKPSQLTNTTSLKGDVGKVSNQLPERESRAPTAAAFLGFQERSDEELSLGPNEVESKDVSLVNLRDCKVVIYGLASTVYVRGLTNSTVTICLACRAITVRDCTNCKFEFVCQQLRIDSTTQCRFRTFTSARSMLESSTGLIFAKLELDDLVTRQKISQGQLSDLVERANFNKLQNNWNCIDDFDWLSPDKPSRNFELCD